MINFDTKIRTLDDFGVKLSCFVFVFLLNHFKMGDGRTSKINTCNKSQPSIKDSSSGLSVI